MHDEERRQRLMAIVHEILPRDGHRDPMQLGRVIVAADVWDKRFDSMLRCFDARFATPLRLPPGVDHAIADVSGQPIVLDHGTFQLPHIDNSWGDWPDEPGQE